MMSDQTDYVDPASTWPAGVPADAALRQLHERLLPIERLLGNMLVEAGDAAAPVDAPSTFGADDQDRADFEAWKAAGRPGRGQRQWSGHDFDNTVTSPMTPGYAGFPAGTPAAEPATGAGPEAGPIPSAGNPDYPDPTPDPTPDLDPDPARKSTDKKPGGR